MRDDLEKYKKVYEMSKELETMYSPFTPQNQFKEQTLVALKQRNGIIDLKEVVMDTSMNVE